jgi:hypothetical protein
VGDGKIDTSQGPFDAAAYFDRVELPSALRS